MRRQQPRVAIGVLANVFHVEGELRVVERGCRWVLLHFVFVHRHPKTFHGFGQLGQRVSQLGL